MCILQDDVVTLIVAVFVFCINPVADSDDMEKLTRSSIQCAMFTNNDVLTYVATWKVF